MNNLFIKKVEEFYETADFYGVGRSFLTIVPAFTGVSVVWPNLHNDEGFLTFARTSFSESTMLSIIDHVNAFLASNEIDRNVGVIPNFHDPEGSRFDELVFHRFGYHSAFSHKSRHLSEMTVKIFPCYRGEFSGDESFPEFDDAIHTLGIGDWNRGRKA